MAPLCLAVLLAVTGQPGPLQKEADAAVWMWKDDDSSLFSSFQRYQGEYLLTIVKPPNSLLSPAARCKPGRHTATALMSIPPSWPFSTVSPGWLSCIVWCSGYTWCVPKSGPVAFAWFVYSCNSQASIALLRLPMGRSSRSTGRWRRPSWRIAERALGDSYAPRCCC